VADVVELRKFLLEESLARYEGEYKELLDTWRDLERKAQAVTTIAGVFLAGVFVLIRQSGPSTGVAISLEIKMFLFLAIILLLLAFFCAILVFNVRERYVAPSSDVTHRLALDLLKVGDEKELQERILFFMHDRISAWKGTNENIAALNREKSQNLWWAQFFLIADIFVMSVIVMLLIFKL
jgi:hypothetical protein